jgi:hypothetical protein
VQRDASADRGGVVPDQVPVRSIHGVSDAAVEFNDGREVCVLDIVVDLAREAGARRLPKPTRQGVRALDVAEISHLEQRLCAVIDVG